MPELPFRAVRELVQGTEIAGYRIDGIAGRGGMGVVYRATQLALDRTVALKVIAPELADDASFRERFKRESKTAALCSTCARSSRRRTGSCGRYLSAPLSRRN